MVEWIEITIPIRLYRLVDVSTLVVEWIEIIMAIVIISS